MKWSIVLIIVFFTVPVWATGCGAATGTVSAPADYTAAATWGAGCTGAGGIPSTTDDVTVGTIRGVYCPTGASCVAQTLVQAASANAVYIAPTATMTIVKPSTAAIQFQVGAGATFINLGTTIVGDSSQAVTQQVILVTGSGSSLWNGGLFQYNGSFELQTTGVLHGCANSTLHAGSAGGVSYRIYGNGSTTPLPSVDTFCTSPPAIPGVVTGSLAAPSVGNLSNFGVTTAGQNFAFSDPTTPDNSTLVLNLNGPYTTIDGSCGGGDLICADFAGGTIYNMLMYQQGHWRLNNAGAATTFDWQNNDMESSTSTVASNAGFECNRSSIAVSGVRQIIHSLFDDSNAANTQLQLGCPNLLWQHNIATVIVQSPGANQYKLHVVDSLSAFRGTPSPSTYPLAWAGNTQTWVNGMTIWTPDTSGVSAGNYHYMQETNTLGVGVAHSGCNIYRNFWVDGGGFANQQADLFVNRGICARIQNLIAAHQFGNSGDNISGGAQNQHYGIEHATIWDDASVGSNSADQTDSLMVLYENNSVTASDGHKQDIFTGNAIDEVWNGITYGSVSITTPTLWTPMYPYHCMQVASYALTSTTMVFTGNNALSTCAAVVSGDIIRLSANSGVTPPESMVAAKTFSTSASSYLNGLQLTVTAANSTTVTATLPAAVCVSPCDNTGTVETDAAIIEAGFEYEWNAGFSKVSLPQNQSSSGCAYNIFNPVTNQRGSISVGKGVGNCPGVYAGSASTASACANPCTSMTVANAAAMGVIQGSYIFDIKSTTTSQYYALVTAVSGNTLTLGINNYDGTNGLIIPSTGVGASDAVAAIQPYWYDVNNPTASPTYASALHYGTKEFVAPQNLYDESCSQLKWDTLNGGPGTYAHLVAEASKLNGHDQSGNPATYNPAYDWRYFDAYYQNCGRIYNNMFSDAYQDNSNLGALNIVTTPDGIVHQETVYPAALITY